MRGSLVPQLGSGVRRCELEATMYRCTSRPQKCLCHTRCKPAVTVYAAAEVAEEVRRAPGSQLATQLSWRISAKVIPHPSKATYGGEDAFFVSSVGGGALGVADGVGGWVLAGINPAEYARTFMHLACSYLEGKSVHPVEPATLEAAEQRPSMADASMDDDGPLDIASTSDGMAALSARGALAAAHAGTRLPGSATACIMRLDRTNGSGVLSAANLGDSGFLLARNGRTIFRSEPQMHTFDCPFQFAAAPEFSQASDHAEAAAVVELELQPGDIIVAGTDGLWDNLEEEELLGLLPDSPECIPKAVERVAAAASSHANDEDFESPYSKSALSQGFDLPFWSKVRGTRIIDGRLQLAYLRGGKLDDITVIMAMVEETAVPEPAVESTPQPVNGIEAQIDNSQSAGQTSSSSGPALADNNGAAEQSQPDASTPAAEAPPGQITEVGQHSEQGDTASQTQ